MKKKRILVAIFVTAIMLILPFNAIAEDSTDILDPVVDPSALSVEEVNNILTTAINELSPYYADDPTFQTIQSIIEEQPLTSEDDLYCFVLLCLIVFFVAMAIGKAINAIWDIIDEEGLLAFIESVLAGGYGIIAMYLAGVFDDECINAPQSPPGPIEGFNDCGCMQSYNAEEVLLQELNQV